MNLVVVEREKTSGMYAPGMATPNIGLGRESLVSLVSIFVDREKIKLEERVWAAKLKNDRPPRFGVQYHVLQKGCSL